MVTFTILCVKNSKHPPVGTSEKEIVPTDKEVVPKIEKESSYRPGSPTLAPDIGFYAEKEVYQAPTQPETTQERRKKLPSS
jgi:hypothetical protein